MVSSSLATVDGSSYPAPSVRPSPVPSSQQRASSSKKTTPPSRLDIVGKHLQDRGISQQAVELICKSWAAGTEKQYKSVWKRWCSWCITGEVDPLQGTAEHVVNFIGDCFKEGKSYSTLNSYRSALSSTFQLIKDDKVGEHPVVTRCLRGIYLAKPPVPRYETTWDVSRVTTYLSTLFPLCELTLKQLTLKTVTLCALVSCQRGQTLWSLDLNNLVTTDDAANFIITERLKTSRPGMKFEVYFPSLPDNPSLCPKSTLLEYIKRTEPFRSVNGQYVSSLFLALVKPHHRVSISTLGRWIKTVLQSSGIDVNVFKPHSVRGASTSALYCRGATISDIMKLASWSNERTFHKYYNRPTARTSVSRMLLSDN